MSFLLLQQPLSVTPHNMVHLHPCTKSDAPRGNSTEALRYVALLGLNVCQPKLP